MTNIVRPVQLQCNNCGAPGVAPKIRRKESRTHIIEEATWTCHRCGTYFKRGYISQEEKPSDKK